MYLLALAGLNGVRAHDGQSNGLRGVKCDGESNKGHWGVAKAGKHTRERESNTEHWVGEAHEGESNAEHMGVFQGKKLL